MQELGLDTNQLNQIVAGSKTVELRLGTPEHLKLRKGMTVQLREDIWQGDEIIASEPTDIIVLIKQVLYFETFEEAFGAVGFQDANPDAANKADALKIYRRSYSAADEYEHGVIAFTIGVV